MGTQSKQQRPDIERVRRDVDRTIEQIERSRKLYAMPIWPLVLVAAIVGGLVGFFLMRSGDVPLTSMAIVAALIAQFSSNFSRFSRHFARF
jgi:hypothetical protein